MNAHFSLVLIATNNGSGEAVSEMSSIFRIMEQQRKRVLVVGAGAAGMFSTRSITVPIR
jgi:hypothetical protein